MFFRLETLGEAEQGTGWRRQLNNCARKKIVRKLNTANNCTTVDLCDDGSDVVYTEAQTVSR